MHATWWDKDRRIFYFVFDFTYTVIDSQELYREVEFPAFGAFGGSLFENPAGNSVGLTLYQGYIGGTAQKYKDWNRNDNNLGNKGASIYSNLFND